MANIKSFPNNQDEYVGAEYLMKWFHGRTSGVFGEQGNSVVESVNGEIAVTVSDGIGWMSNEDSNGIVWWNDSFAQTGTNLKLNFELPDAVFDRIDRIVVTWETTDYVALPTISILKGVASSSPVAPSLTNNSTTRQISLARVTVQSGASYINPSLIVDERLDNSVCGLVTENVSVDTTMLMNQFNEFLSSSTQEFNNWFETLETVLSGDVAANLLNMINQNAEDISKKADKSKQTETTLVSSSWVNVGGVNQITLSISGVTANSINEIIPALNISPEQLTQLQKANIQDGGQSEGQITLLSYGDKPTLNIPVRVIIRGDAV